MKTLTLKTARLEKLALHLFQYHLVLKENTKQALVMIDKNTIQEEGNTRCYLYPIIEAVFVFSNEWKFNEYGKPYWIHDKNKNTICSTLDYFGLSRSTFCHLFVPGMQSTSLYGGKKLTAKAPPKIIAGNILELIRISNIRQN